MNGLIRLYAWYLTTAKLKEYRVEAPSDFAEWTDNHENCLNKIVAGNCNPDVFSLTIFQRSNHQMTVWFGRTTTSQSSRDIVQSEENTFFDFNGIIHGGLVPSDQMTGMGLEVLQCEEGAIFVCEQKKGVYYNFVCDAFSFFFAHKNCIRNTDI